MNLAKKIKMILPPSLKAGLRPYQRRMDKFFAYFSDYVTPGVKIIFGKITRQIWRPKFPNSDIGTFVNLGCGKTNHPKFINVDGFPHPHVHFVHRIDRLPMFEKNSVDLIYASHCLEHFRYLDIDRVLCEWLRVLKPGGILRLSVPDFDKLVAIYNNTMNPDDIVEQVMGGQNNRYNFHYVLFNKNNLTNKLIRAGCTDVKEWVPGDSNLTTFADFSVWQKEIAGNKYPISLNIEARKA